MNPSILNADYVTYIKFFTRCVLVLYSQWSKISEVIFLKEITLHSYKLLQASTFI